MKNIKDITISIFAIIGFVTILSSFNNQTQETHSTVPESHIWEFHSVKLLTLNKVTGEVRKYNNINPTTGKDGALDTYSENSYALMVEKRPK